MSKYSEDLKIENKDLPTLYSVIEASAGYGVLSPDQLNTIHSNVSRLMLEVIPELVYLNMSDSYRFEGGFEECTKQFFINLEKIGVSKKEMVFNVFESPNFEKNALKFFHESGQIPKELESKFFKDGDVYYKVDFKGGVGFRSFSLKDGEWGPLPAGTIIDIEMEGAPCSDPLKWNIKNKLHFLLKRKDSAKQSQNILTEARSVISDKILTEKINYVSSYIKVLEEENRIKKLIVGALILLCVYQFSEPIISETRSCVGPFLECFSDAMSGNIVAPLINPQN
jgi:hypothetical protein